MARSRTSLALVIPAAIAGLVIYLATVSCGLMTLGTIIAGISGAVSS